MNIFLQRNKKNIISLGIAFSLLALLIVFLGCQEQKSASAQTKAGQRLDDYLAITTIGDLNMRVEPHQDATRMLQLAEGTVLEVIDRSQNRVRIGKGNEFWYHLRTENGITGWVYGSFLMLVTGKDKSKAAELAVKQIREQKKQLVTKIAGYWYQQRSDGSEGPYRLITYDNGTYMAFSKQGKRLYQGDMDIQLKNRVIEFKKDTSFGSKLNFHYDEEKNEYSLSYTRGDTNFQMQRVTDEKIPTKKDLEKDGYRIQE